MVFFELYIIETAYIGISACLSEDGLYSVIFFMLYTIFEEYIQQINSAEINPLPAGVAYIRVFIFY